jgi:hypothetical protein
LKKKLRQIVIDGKSYLWKYTLSYKDMLKSGPLRSWKRHALFTAYRFGIKNGPLYISVNWGELPEENQANADVFLDTSGIDFDEGCLYVMPERAAKLIRLALEHGWQPEQSQKPFRHIVFLKPYTLVKSGPPLPSNAVE